MPISELFLCIRIMVLLGFIASGVVTLYKWRTYDFENTYPWDVAPNWFVGTVLLGIATLAVWLAYVARLLEG